jgi:serine/threonine-protein kinase
VVDITDVGEEGTVAYLVMEYLEGEPLSIKILREGPLAADVIADILIPVAAALHAAHAMGIIHRDLKPDNIFLTYSVQGNIHPKILDFGISKVLGDEKSPRLTYTSNVMLGTPNYVSPEQLETPHAITPRSDQYSLGVVIYEAATGNNPFAGHSSLMSILRAIERGDYPLPHDVNAHIDERLERVALRAMAISPNARYPSMAALAAELLPLASPDTRFAWARYFASDFGGTAASSTPRSVPRHQQPPRRGVWLAAAASLGMAGAGLAAFLATEPNQPGAVEAQTLPIEPAPRAAPALRAGAGSTRVALGEPAAPPPSISRTSVTEMSPAEPPPSPPKAGRPRARVSDSDAPRPRTAKAREQREPPPDSAPARQPPARARAADPSDRDLEREPDDFDEPLPRAAAPSPERADPLKTDNVDPWDNPHHSP